MKEYGRIWGCCAALLCSTQVAHAQFGNAAARPALELPAGIEEILKVDDGPLLVQSTTPANESIYAITSIEGQMILLAQTENGTRVFVPQHISPNALARLFGGTIIPARSFVSPILGQR
jgi:hypothetical protein